jgi:hypothetical protein
MSTKAIPLVVGSLGAMLLALSAGPARAQEPQPANPSLNLTLTETMRRVAEEAAKRDDLRPTPPARGPAWLPESFRVTVSAGDPQCWPGEERMMGIERARRASRSARPR